MSQNKILKDIAIKLGATVGEHVNDTNELLTAIAVALGATPTKKYNNVKDTLELIRDNISEGGSGGSTLKKFLDNKKTAKQLFINYSGDNLLELIQYDDTENVNDFDQMFYNCANATNVPALNTSNGTIFSGMYNGCSSVTTFPEIDTSNGTKFNGMYYNCANATNVPALNTSNGTDFTSMYSGCNSVTTFPEIDTSNGINFMYMYKGCSKATSFPALDTSKAYYLGDMYNGCNNTKKIDISHYNISFTMDSGNWCSNCNNLLAVVIRSFGSSYLLNSTSFTNSCHLLGIKCEPYNPEGLKDGYIYVPRDMIETLSTATNWSEYASQLRALEDYTVDGTTTGEFDEEKAFSCYYVRPIADQFFIEPGTKTCTIPLREFVNTPTVSVVSDNEEFATISNLHVTTSEITFDINVLGSNDSSTISVSVSGDHNSELTLNAVYVNYAEPTYTVTKADGATYGFFLNDDNEYYKSSNTGVYRSYSLSKILINNPNPTGLVKMTLTCINNTGTEASNDYGMLSYIDTELSLSYDRNLDSNVYKSFKNESSDLEQEVVYDLPNGEHFVHVKYIKDAMKNGGNDSLQFKVSFGV